MNRNSIVQVTRPEEKVGDVLTEVKVRGSEVVS